MPKSQGCLLLPSLRWSHTGKRGRERGPRFAETPEHIAALFLLSLSYPNAVAQDEPGREEGRLHECSICPKKFATGRALGGHMKSAHLERDLKGRIVKRKMRKISSLGFGLDLDFGFSTTSLPHAFSGRKAIQEDEDVVDESTPQASHCPFFKSFM